MNSICIRRMLMAPVLILALCLQSCATIFTGTRDILAFNSNPSGAKVEINGVTIGTTPFTYPMKRSLSTPSLLFKKDGYQPKMVQLGTKFNVVSILSILFGFIGIGVDLATGAVVKYDPIGYQVDLDPNTSTGQNK